MKEKMKREIVRLAEEQRTFKRERREAALLPSPDREPELARTQSRVARRRAEIRATLLAYAMCRRMPRTRLEPTFRLPGANPWSVRRVLESFGREATIDEVREWLGQ